MAELHSRAAHTTLAKSAQTPARSTLRGARGGLGMGRAKDGSVVEGVRTAQGQSAASWHTGMTTMMQQTSPVEQSELKNGLQSQAPKRELQLPEGHSASVLQLFVPLFTMQLLLLQIWPDGQLAVVMHCTQVFCGVQTFPLAQSVLFTHSTQVFRLQTRPSVQLLFVTHCTQVFCAVQISAPGQSLLVRHSTQVWLLWQTPEGQSVLVRHWRQTPLA